MTELDQRIRRMILRYPSLIPNRTSALLQIFCTNGNGHRWVDGRVTEDGPFDEGEARAGFFRDIDRQESELASIGDPSLEAGLRMRRAQRQLLLDHLDDVVIDKASRSGRDAWLLMATYYRRGWLAMNIPDDAEPSYRAGALEALSSVLQTLRAARLDGHPRVEEMAAEYRRQTPGRAAVFAMLGLKPEPDPGVVQKELRRVFSIYAVAIDPEAFADLMAAERSGVILPNERLRSRLQGTADGRSPEIPGVEKAFYPDDETAEIHVRLAPGQDQPTTHAAICRLITDQVARARTLLSQHEAGS